MIRGWCVSPGVDSPGSGRKAHPLPSSYPFPYLAGLDVLALPVFADLVQSADMHHVCFVCKVGEGPGLRNRTGPELADPPPSLQRWSSAELSGPHGASNSGRPRPSLTRNIFVKSALYF